MLSIVINRLSTDPGVNDLTKDQPADSAKPFRVLQ